MGHPTPNPPGVAGYLLAWLVADAVFTLGLWAPIPFEGTVGAVDALGWAAVLAVMVGLYSVPFAAFGLLAVHVACARVSAQWVHVVAAGVVGILPMLLFGVLARESAAVPFAAVPLATALGRAVVVPLVWHRRNSAAPAVTG